MPFSEKIRERVRWVGDSSNLSPNHVLRVEEEALQRLGTRFFLGYSYAGDIDTQQEGGYSGFSECIRRLVPVGVVHLLAERYEPETGRQVCSYLRELGWSEFSTISYAQGWDNPPRLMSVESIARAPAWERPA